MPVISGIGLPAIRFLVSDAAGNLASDSGQRIVIRLRVVRTILNGTSSLRRLLNDLEAEETSDSCPGGGSQYFWDSNGEVIISDAVICKAGNAMLAFDVGYIGPDGSFVAVTLSAMSASIIVARGKSAVISLLSANATTELSFARISTLVYLRFLDKGHNVVNGSDEITVFLVNSTAFEVAVPGAFNLSCAEQDEPLRCGIPASYIYSAEPWGVASSVATVTLAVRSASHIMVGTGVELTITPSCAPGSVVNVSVTGPRLKLPYSFFPVTNRSQLCQSCKAGSISTSSDSNICLTCPAGTAAAANHSVCVSCFGNSWSPAGTQGSCINCPDKFKAIHKFDDCVSLEFSGMVPKSVVAQVPFSLPCIGVINIQHNIVNSSNGNISIILACTFPLCSASLESVLYQDRFALTDGSACPGFNIFPGPSGQFINMHVGENFQWTLEFEASVNMGIPSMQVVSEQRTKFLGRSPIIMNVRPSRTSFLGGSVLSVTASWPILPSIRLAANWSEYCIFSVVSSSSGVKRHVSKAAQIDDGHVRLCISPSGPAFHFFELHVQLADERVSIQSALVDVFCPAGHFVFDGECVRCPSGPSGSSTSLAINASLIQSCVCDIGSYGTHGQFCITCPKVPALNCSQVGLLVPQVNPGFYADFSKLKDCSWSRAECGAVTACPFGSRACPGGLDLQCTRSQAECYQGWGCAKCCKMYFLENSRCLACPDISESMILLGVLAGFVVALGVIVSSATSPSVINSVKYFVLSINFMQNVMALKLFDIPWPTVVISLFDWLKLFSFSIAAVRPECAFSWDFETKVAITILSPILLSLAISCLGLIFGMYRCFNIFMRLDAVRCKLKNSIPYSTWASVFKCWLVVVFFLSVDYSEKTIMWFALSPFLSNRLKTRSVKDAKTNWASAASKLRALNKSSALMKSMGVTGCAIGDKLDYRNLAKLQDILKKEGLDIEFARAVQAGRKFASGMFSVLVLSFVGTLTSILSVSKCSDRDGSSFLVQDQDIECNFSSAAYTRLFSLAIFGFFVYSILLPLLIVTVLGSAWCSKMRMQDYAAYEAIFGFLVARYSRRHFRWEAMVFVMKSASVAVPVYFTNSPVRQSICMMFMSLAYIIMLFKYSPFANQYLNFSEKVSHLSLFCMYFSAILFLGSVDSSPIVEGFIRELLGIWLCVICVLSILLTFRCALCELAFLALVHKNQFVSKWQAALSPHFGNTLKEGLPTPFAFLYVYYNAISRRDIGQKTRIYNEAVAERLVLLELKNKDLLRRGLLFRVRRMWIYLIVGIEQKFLSMCNPVTVLNVADSEDAKFLALLSQLEYDMQAFQKNHTKLDKIWPKICRFIRCMWFHRKIAPVDEEKVNLRENNDASHRLSAPQDVVSSIYELRSFLTNTFSQSARQTLLCLLLFDRSGDFGSSPESLKYISQLMRQSESAKTCIRSLFSLEIELLKKRDQNIEGTLRYTDRLVNSLVGRDALIISAFNSMNSSNRIAAFKKFKFPNIDDGECVVPSVDELLHDAMQSFQFKVSDGTARVDYKNDVLQSNIRSIVLQNSHQSNVEPHLSTVVNPVCAKFECPATCDATEYTGEMKEGFYDGICTALFCNGDRYDGHLSNGKRQGNGKFTWASGDTYDGEWRNDAFEGFGILKCEQYVFEGHWLHAQKAGKGRIVFDCGDIYDGNWEQNLYHGDGWYAFSNGDMLKGKWLHGKFAQETSSFKEKLNIRARKVPGIVAPDEALSMYDMMFSSAIDRVENCPKEHANSTKMMQLLEDTQRYRKDVELAESQKQERETKIKLLEEQCQRMRREEADLACQIAEVAKQRQAEEIRGKIRLLRQKRDAFVSEQNVLIIEAMRAQITALQNAKKELQKKLTVKRYRDYQKFQQNLFQNPNVTKIKSKQEVNAELRANMPKLQFELNQTQAEMAGLCMAKFNLTRNLESMLLENRSLRSQLGLPPVKHSDNDD